jgi:hypothetical protein
MHHSLQEKLRYGDNGEARTDSDLGLDGQLESERRGGHELGFGCSLAARSERSKSYNWLLKWDDWEDEWDL